jgi:hypothetical protein
MNNEYLNDKLFDTMLEVACKEIMDECLAEWDSADTEPHEFSPEFERKMAKLLRGYKRRFTFKKIRKGIVRSLIVLLIVMSLGFTVTMSVQALRIQFFNTFIEFADEHMGFSFGEVDAPPVTVTLRPLYLPEGYSEDSVVEKSSGVRILYRNQDGGRIALNIYSKQEGLNIRVDREHSEEPYGINISGVDAQVYEGMDGYDNSVYWERDNLFFMLIGSAPSDELVEMARSMTEIPGK